MKTKIWLAFASAILLLAFPSLADENGKIYQLSYSPDEPVVLEDLKLSIGVENPTGASHDYLLEVIVAKDGKVESFKEFTFSLDKGKGISFNPTHPPNHIGRHEIIVRLYDKFKIDLYDTRITDFNSVSNIGPFDIIVEPMTTRVRPGIFLPTKLILENMGEKGTDVEIRVSVNCPNRTLTQRLTVFMPAGIQNERLLSVETCQEEGQFDVAASILIFDREWVSSSSHFYVNASYIQLGFDAPENITLKPGQSLSFPVEVTNNGNREISDLKFVVQRIPLSWQQVSPSSIVSVNPNETVVFIVNITVPQDAESDSYDVRMTAVGEETLERKITRLYVAPLAVAPIPQPLAAPAFNVLWVLAGLIATGAAGFVARKKLRDRQEMPSYTPPERADMLRRIKEKIRK